MRIILSGTPEDLDHARDWICDPRLYTVLEDLELALTNLEMHWGPCTAFIECAFPLVAHIEARQTDLVIAFRDRVALCELKQGLGGKIDGATVHRATRQLGRQIENLRMHLKA